MEYYKLLQLKREPFSNSPDPDYFFQSQQHHACLQKLELAIRLKRGLNVVIGEVGTGKTTLCRELIRRFSEDGLIETHLVLDPSFDTPIDFLMLLRQMICDAPPPAAITVMNLKEQIKQALYTKGVEKQMTVVLIVDEGQKMTTVCAEILRELLNFETNNYKLLQIAIFAQQEFEQVLEAHANFADRINLLHHLGPLNFTDTRRMIHHRLKRSSSTAKPQSVFTLPAQWAIYRATNGYPRKIIHLCHQSVLAMIIQNRTRAGWHIVRTSKKRLSGSHRRWFAYWATAAVVLLLLATVTFYPSFVKNKRVSYNEIRFSVPAGADIASVSMPQAVQAPPDHDLDPAESRPEPRSPIDTMPSKPQEAALPQEPILAAIAVEPIVAAESIQQAPQVDQPVQEEKESQLSRTPDAKEPPALLGELAVVPGDTLVGLVRTVYGSTANRFIREVIEANPQLENPNAIDLGDVIRFPAIPMAADTDDTPRYRITVQTSDSIAEARYDSKVLEHKWQRPFRMIARWQPDEGLVFHLVWPAVFQNEQDAISWLNRQSDELSKNAEIHPSWPDHGVLFSKP